MKFVYQHLKIKADSPEKTADLLSSHTQEVERILPVGIKASGVITGQVISVKKHPNADRLNQLEVSIKEKILTILTSATVHENDKVAVATVGSSVITVNRQDINTQIDSRKMTTISRQTIRGITSEGMLCGEDELGLSESASHGVMILPPDTPLGLPLEKIFPVKQIIETDDKGTAHRSDLLSYRGIEQELAAILGQKINTEELESPKELRSPNIQASIEATDGCRLFLTALINLPSNKFSPKWLTEFLTDNQIKTINLATDITNYVMLTEGYPTHAFDASTITGNKVSVRYAAENETVQTLNHREYKLKKTDLVIADSEKPLDLAGIIGGEKTAISDQTKQILLTCALFDPIHIRRTSQSFGIRTEASARFERGLSTAAAINGFNKALRLILDLSDGQLIDLRITGDDKQDRVNIKTKTAEIRSLLGKNIDDQKIVTILKNLNFDIEIADGNLNIICPWWRQDVRDWQDIAEEVARIYGYEEIPRTLPSLLYDQTKEWSLKQDFQIVRKTAAEFLYEVQTSSMVSLGNKDAIRLANPIGDKKFMRQNLTDGLIQLTIKKYREGFNDFGCFEVGHIYVKDQPLKFAAALVAKQAQAKNLLGIIFHRLGLDYRLITFQTNDQTKTVINYKKTAVGEFKATWQAPIWIFSWELDMQLLNDQQKQNGRFKAYSRLPKIKRDLAIVLDKNIDYGTVVKMIEKQSSLISKISLFDEIDNYNGQNNFRSLAFHLEFSDEKRTLQNEEINVIIQNIEENLKNKLKAVIR